MSSRFGYNQESLAIVDNPLLETVVTQQVVSTVNLDAYRTSVEQDSIDANFITQTTLNGYRSAGAQDIIDSGKYSTSNPSGYQTASDVSSALGPYLTSSSASSTYLTQTNASNTYQTQSAMSNYRTAINEDIINATKLDIVDLISDLVPHPAGSPATFEGVVACGGIENGFAQTSTGNIEPFSALTSFTTLGLDFYDNVGNGIVNFKGSNYYSFNLSTSTVAGIKETAGVYTILSPSTIYTTQSTNHPVFKFASNNNVLVAISKNNAQPYIFYTTDGITWTPYFDDYPTPKRELVIIDDIVYIGTDYDIQMISVSDLIANVPYTTAVTYQPALSLVNSIVKLNSTDFLFMSETGIYKTNMSGSSVGTAGGPTSCANIGYTSIGKIVNTPWGIYAISGTSDLNIYKSTNLGETWSSVTITDPNFNTVDALYYSSDINIVLFGGYTNTSRIGTIDSSDNIVYYNTGLNTNRQDTGNFYIFDFGNRYSGGGGSSGVSVLLNSGASVTTNVYDTLLDLSTANNQIRTKFGDYSTSSEVTTEIANSQNAQNFTISNTYLSTANASFTYLTILSASSQYQSIAGMSNYLTSVDAQNTYLTQGNATSTYLSIVNASNTYKLQSEFNTQFGYLLRPNIKIVTATGGSTTPALGQSYSTIESAISSATSGQTVVVCPGTYTLSGPLTIPSNISIMGFDKRTCIIQYTSTTNNTMITMGANTGLSCLTINHNCATAGVDCSTITISGTDNITSLISECVITSTHTGASTGSMKLINATCTGQYTDISTFTIKNCDMTVNGNNTGANRVILLSGTNGQISIDSCQMSCLRSAGSGTNFICCETNASGSVLLISNSLISGFSNDISQTSGTLSLGKSTILYNASSNNLSFNPLSNSCEYLFCHIGNAGGVRYLTPAGEVNNVVSIRISRPTVIYNLFFNARVLTTGVIDITVFKNGSATTLTCKATNVTSAQNTTVGIQFNAGDLLAIQANRASGTITDYYVQISAY